MHLKFFKNFHHVSPHARHTTFFLYYRFFKRLSPLFLVVGLFWYLSLLGNIPFHQPENLNYNENHEIPMVESLDDPAPALVPVNAEIKSSAETADIVSLYEPKIPAISEHHENHTEINGILRRGESFSRALKRSKINPEIRQQIITGYKGCLDFKKLRPKDRYKVILDENGQLVKCLYESGPLEVYTLTRSEDQLTARRKEVLVESRTVTLSGIIEYSLTASFQNFKESSKLIFAFADIFASQIDFNTETRNGDRYSLVFEKYYKDDQMIGYGKIIYARYEQQLGDNVLEAFFYTDNSGVSGYFDSEGQELRSSFIKSPVPVGRVSSRFTNRRRHPILGVVRPHLGVDLAAPFGTPVMAAADGIIKSIGRNGGFGKQIIIRHANGYESYYGHLSKYQKNLRKGSRVKQKDIIGYIGSTGLATGPHLDYRIQHNGIFKNPFSLKFKPKSILRGESLANFKEFIASAGLAINNNQENPQIVEVKQLSVSSDDDIFFL